MDAPKVHITIFVFNDFLFLSNSGFLLSIVILFNLLISSMIYVGLKALIKIKYIFFHKIKYSYFIIKNNEVLVIISKKKI